MFLRRFLNGLGSEKYTKHYFTGLSDDGSKLHYGIEGVCSGSTTVLRDFDIKILDRVNFENAHVLEIGFGRGESIKYFMEKGVASYIGVDFALPAFELAKEYVVHHGFSKARLFCADAIDFLKDQGHEITQPIDIVVLLDVVEHIPREELRQTLELLKPYLAQKAIIIINTPVYRVDNDVIVQGLDEKNHIDAIDHADFIEETKGMHCNKYSLLSLSNFMKKSGFINLTERQIYTLNFQNNKDYEEIPSYRNLWEETAKNNYPIHVVYQPDEHEFAYIQGNPLEIIKCEEGSLLNCKILGINSQITQYLNEHSDINHEIKQGDIVFDVGGHVGLSSLHYSKLVSSHGKIFCFEPNSANINRMRINLSENPELAENIHLYDFGLGEKTETCGLLLSEDIEFGYSSTSQLTKRWKNGYSSYRTLCAGLL